MIIELVSVRLQLEEKCPMLALWELLPNFFRLVFIAVGFYILNSMSQNRFDLKGHGERKIVDVNTPNTQETFFHSWAFGLGNFLPLFICKAILL